MIDTDGEVAAGRPETEIGAGSATANRGVIHVCLIGGHGSAASDLFAEHFTPEQDAALRVVISNIEARARIRRVSGHNEWPRKPAPDSTSPPGLKEPDPCSLFSSPSSRSFFP